VIDWGSFLVVGAVSLFAATAIVSVYAVGLRLLYSPAGQVTSRPRRIAGFACFALCALGVLYGIWLIVPALGG
jgi:hypothetical protein